MNVLDLFSGIGGFSLGFERAGPFRTVAFCEREAYPRAVLARRWPGVPCYDDVRTLTADRLRADGVVWPDLICGGFPCQDISLAGLGAGIDGARSGLWREMAGIVAECRPRWVVAENVPGLRRRGADRVLGDLEALGYACWPLVVGAVHAGAWHRRQRVWIIAYLSGDRRGNWPGEHLEVEGLRASAHARRDGADGTVPDVDCVREHECAEGRHEARHWFADGVAVSDPDFQPQREPGHQAKALCNQRHAWMEFGRGGDRQPLEDATSPLARDGVAHAAVTRLEIKQHGHKAERPAAVGACGGSSQPGVVRVVHGLSDRLDRRAGMDWSHEPENTPRTARGVPHRVPIITALGNAVVPANAAMIGRAIMSVEAAL